MAVYANPLVGDLRGLLLVETDGAMGVEDPLLNGRRFITGVRDGGFAYGRRIERIHEHRFSRSQNRHKGQTPGRCPRKNLSFS